MLVIKEEFVGGEKYRRAVKLGRGDAILMWLAMKRYASEHPTSEGFVPDEDVDELPGAPRAPRKSLQVLVECGRLLPDGRRGPGLVEPAEGGWQLHDYLDHSAAPEDIELRRERARLKKQRPREEKRRELEQIRLVMAASPVDGDMSPGQQGDRGGHVHRDSSGDVPGTVLAGARPPAHARTRDPNPAQPSPTQPKNLPSLTSEIRDPRARDADPGTRGYERVEPQSEHKQFAAEHRLDLDRIVQRFNTDPRTKTLSTIHAWAALSRLLEDEAAQQERLGGAA